MTVQSPPRPAKDEQLDPRVRRIAFRQKLGKFDVKVSPYLYISPFFIIFAITGLFPLIYTGYISVHNWGLLTGNQGFNGLDNYTSILGQDAFWKALRNTFSIFLLSSVPQVIAAIIIAAILNANLRAKTFWRMGVLLPYIVAPIAISMIFGKMFDDRTGVINGVLELVGASAIGWHSDVFASHVAIATMVNFRWTGYNTLVFLAAMQAIPSELYEAAIIDGAGRLRQFFSITIPQLRATIIFVIITSTIGGLQIFDEAKGFDYQGSGGGDDQWLTLTMYIYELGWGPQQNFGRASAVAWLLFLVIIIIGALNYLLSSKISSSGAPKKTKKLKKVK